MEKRKDYISNDQEHFCDENLHNASYDGTDAINVGIAGAMASGNTMQTSAHSTGLLFEQSIAQQNNQFQLAMTNTINGSKDLLTKNVNLKGTHLALKNDLFEVLESFK